VGDPDDRSYQNVLCFFPYIGIGIGIARLVRYLSELWIFPEEEKWVLELGHNSSRPIGI
jgi:hypothetical protein